MSSEIKRPIFCIALDIEKKSDFQKVVLETENFCDVFKVGPVSFSSLGFFPLEFLSDRNKDIFLDLKFFDIPSVVGRAIKNFLTFRIKFITVHILGGKDMVRQAYESAKDKGAEIVGVTVLTSSASEESRAKVLELVKNSADWGINWVVASPLFSPEIKKMFGEKIKIVSPGIRVKYESVIQGDESNSTGKDDHAFAFTPSEAIKLGSDMIVVGRPIFNSKNPALIAMKVREEIEKSLKE